MRMQTGVVLIALECGLLLHAQERAAADERVRQWISPDHQGMVESDVGFTQDGVTEYDLLLSRGRRKPVIVDRYQRSVDVAWSSDSKYVAISDWISSNVADCYVIAARKPQRIVSLIMALPKLPETSSHAHLYVSCDAWRNSSHIAVRVSGHTDNEPSYDFDYRFTYNVVTNKLIPDQGLNHQGYPSMPSRSASIPVRAAITAFYRVLLMRELDAVGLEAHVANVVHGTRTLQQSIAVALEFEEFQAIAPRVLAARAHSDQRCFTNDHTQFGEFGILLRQRVDIAARNRIVVDVGARRRERSNSYDLLKVLGWRGLPIEANPTLIGSITADFAGANFDLLNCAISDYDGRATFHIGVNDDVSSLNPDAASSWGAIHGAVTVDVKRLAPLLRARAIPPDFDLLSLDIEGRDIKVLNDLIGGGVYWPRFVIIEASFDYRTTSLNDLEVSDAVKLGHQMVGQTSANLILRRKAGIR